MPENSVIDSKSTTFEWKNVRSGICILPVGSLEQHSHHMPLATDTIIGEYFSRFLAQELDAALLPALSIATSLEHTGFRGSFSLRPETLMAVIRDLADEAERQDFTTMVIVNAHGGNFSLAPVTRDINRVDRKIKIILCAPHSMSSTNVPGDIHAGESETSMMLHVCPELVGEERVDIAQGEACSQRRSDHSRGEPSKRRRDSSASPRNDPTCHPEPQARDLASPREAGRRWLDGEFIQSDLNLYGMKHVSPEGAVGFPSKATPQKGEAIVAEIKEALLAFVRRRLEWLAESRGYGE